MLGKLLKHEFYATGRIMLPLLAAELVLSVFAGFSVRGLSNAQNMGLLSVMYVTTLTVFFLGLFAVWIVALVLMIQRFYRNLLRDEGYLSMTLPVSVDEHILTKLIVPFVWFAALALLSVIALTVVMSIGSKIGMADFHTFFEGWPVEFGAVGGGQILLFCLELLLVCFLSSCASCLRCYAAMSIGCSAAEHKLLFSFLTFIGIGIVVSTLRSQFFFAVLPNLELSSFTAMADSARGALLLMHGAMWSVILGLAFYCALLYFATRWFLKNKLNLA
ncbi:MAG: hypothetical protein K6F56_05955 [Oscillospiraceae bacterium]|nr:hypothetical protein [Oscillospiraceae bacterium]